MDGMELKRNGNRIAIYDFDFLNAVIITVHLKFSHADRSSLSKLLSLIQSRDK